MTQKNIEEIRQDFKFKLEPKLAELIVKTLQKLPDDIYKYTLENVQFEKSMDCCLPLPQIKKPFLVMVKEDATESKIAHEIAHAYLKHPAYTDISVEQAEKFEEEAKNLASKWLERV